MGLNVKLASLVCLSFIGGICWLVNQVTRPLVEVPASLTAQYPNDPPTRTVYAGDNGISRRFSRPSAASAPIERRESPSTMQPVAAGPTIPLSSREALPPLHVPPKAPLVAASDASSAASTGVPATDAEPLVARDGAARTDPELMSETPQTTSLQPALTAAASPTSAARPMSADADTGQRVGASGGVAPAATAASAGPTRYTVKTGENLTRIARALLGRDDAKTLRTLLDANPNLKKRSGRVLAGETLNIPALASAKPVSDPMPNGTGTVRGAKPAAAAPLTNMTAPPGIASAAKPPAKPAAAQPARSAAGNKPPASADRGAARQTASVSRQSPKASTAKPAGATKSTQPKSSTARAASGTPANRSGKTQWVTVQRGESLRDVAQRHLKDGRRWREIAELNGLRESERVPSGKRLRVPGGAGVDT